MRNYFLLLFLPLSWTAQLVNATLKSDHPLAADFFDDAATIRDMAGGLTRAKSSGPGACGIDPKVVQAPFNSSDAPLGEPPNNTVVTYVAVGVGYANYTCNDTSTDPPEFIGSAANLFDASCLADNPDLLTGLPRLLNKISTDSVSLFALLLDRFTSSPDERINGFQIGQLYYDGSPSEPTFDFSLVNGGMIQASPGNSSQAPNVTGVPKAVDWVRLGHVTSLESGKSTNITDIYRVWTAGGVSPDVCKKKREVSTVPYSAVYFVYSSSH